MGITVDREYRFLGKTSGCEDHDHDLVHDLGKRLDALWHYDQYIANASEKPHIKETWELLKKQEQDNIGKIKTLIREEIANNCF